MKINIGSTNERKIQAVREILSEYDFLAGAELQGLAVEPEVSPQPISLEETVRGAINRAKNAYHNCNLSVGQQDGLIVLNSPSGYAEVTICACYDGYNICCGMSQSIPRLPEEIELVKKEKITITEAFDRLGLRTSEQDEISIITNGKITYLDIAKQALRSALIAINKNWKAKYESTVSHEAWDVLLPGLVD